jgi:CheY-like chemotaxis protein
VCPGRQYPEAEEGSGARILLVEDDRAVAEMYRLKLRRDGFTVQIAEDGDRAIDLARRQPPDLVLLDVRLPKRDGLQVLAAMRRDPPTAGVPIVVLSNYSEDLIVQRSLALGATEYLVKAHTTPEMLSASLRRWLNGGGGPAGAERAGAHAEEPEVLPPGH